MALNPQMLSPAFQQTRHARRIYVGGIPPNYADEEALKYFLNSVIAKGIGEENNNDYVLSMYINQKKCFAFVELRSIELATACLALDSIVYKKVVLKVLRANEYKPELVPPSMIGKPIVLDLSSFAFGTTAAPVTNTQAVPLQSITNIIKEQQESDLRLDSIIQFNAPVPSIESKSIVMVGFPYDENLIRRALSASINSTSSGSNHSLLGREGRSLLGGGLGCAAAPKVIRQTIRKMKFGAVENPEFDISLSATKINDIGDIPSGATPEDTKNNLSRIVAEAVCRGGVPFIVGGSAECSYYSALGLIDICSGPIGVVSVSAQLGDNKLLEDSRFCGPIAASMYDLTSATGFVSPQSMQGASNGSKIESGGSAIRRCDNSCDGKYIRFGAQGSQCSQEASRYVLERGGQIMWLTKDIRNKKLSSSSSLVTSQVGAWFEKALKNAAYGVNPVIVSLDMGVLQYWNTSVNSTNVISNLNNNSHVNTNNSAIGLTIDEVLEIAMIAGADPNVVVFDLTEFNPEAEDSSRGNLLPAELFYRFALGVAARPASNPVVDPESERSKKYLTCSSGSVDGTSPQEGGHTPIVMIHPSNLNNNSLDNILVSSQKAVQAATLKEKQAKEGILQPTPVAPSGIVHASDAASLSSTSFDSYCRLGSISLDDQSQQSRDNNILHLSAEQMPYSELHYGLKGRGLAAPLVQPPHHMLARQLSMNSQSMGGHQTVQQQQQFHSYPASTQSQPPMIQQLSHYDLHETRSGEFNEMSRGAFNETSFAGLEFAREGYGNHTNLGGGGLNARALSDNAMLSPLSHQNSYVGGTGGINGALSGRSMSDNAITAGLRGGFGPAYNNASNNSLVNSQFAGGIAPQPYRDNLYDPLKSPISPLRPGPPNLGPPSLTSPPHTSNQSQIHTPPTQNSHSAPASVNRQSDQRYTQTFQPQQQFANQGISRQYTMDLPNGVNKPIQQQQQMLSFDEVSSNGRQQQQQFGGHRPQSQQQPGMNYNSINQFGNQNQQQQPVQYQYPRQPGNGNASDLNPLGPANRDNHPRGGNLFRAASNMSMISTSDIHEFDEAVDLFDHPPAANRSRHNAAPQHHSNSFIQQSNSTQQPGNGNVYLGTASSGASSSSQDMMWNLK